MSLDLGMLNLRCILVLKVKMCSRLWDNAQKLVRIWESLAIMAVCSQCTGADMCSVPATPSQNEATRYCVYSNAAQRTVVSAF